MSRFSPEQYRLDVASAQLSLSVKRRGILNWECLALLPEPTVKGERSFSARLSMCMERLPRGARCETVIDDALARLFVLSAPPQVASLKELQLVANLRAASLFGDVSEAWTCVADWRARGPFLVCAVPKALLQDVLDVAAQRRVQMAHIQTAFVREWNAHRSAMRENQAWMAWIGHHVSVLAATQRGRIVAISQWRMTAPSDLNALGVLLRRASLQWGMAGPSLMYIVGEHAAAWHAGSVQDCRIFALASPWRPGIDAVPDVAASMPALNAVHPTSR